MSRCITIGVLVPTHGQAPTDPPETRPIGRAALSVATDGVDVVFGDAVREGCISGYRAIPGGWEPVDSVPFDAIHDRFPSQLRAQRYAEILQGVGDLPMGNPVAFTMLCRDKLKTQRVLEAQGVPFLSEVAPCCSGTHTDTGGIVHAIDPDGVFLELVGNLEPRPVAPQPEHCPPLEIRYPASRL